MIPDLDMKDNLRGALLSAFPSKNDLEQLVYFKLDGKNLDHIVETSGQNLSGIVFKLIQWSESKGCLGKLIQGAYEQNPENPELKKIKDAYFSISSYGVSVPTAYSYRRKVFTQLGIIVFLTCIIILIIQTQTFFAKTPQDSSFPGLIQSSPSQRKEANNFLSTPETLGFSGETQVTILYTQEIDRELFVVWKDVQARQLNDIPQDVELIEQNDSYVVLVAKASAEVSSDVPWQISSKRRALEKIALYMPELFNDLRSAEYFFVRGDIENADFDSDERSATIWLKLELGEE
jgi:hypothetical protein